MSDESARTYDCPKCDEVHNVVEDEDGYGLANCVRGTILVYTPEEA